MPFGKSATLHLQFFDGWATRVGDMTLPRPRSQQGQWLLALLVLKRAAPVERVWLAGALWPESNDTQALYNLRRNLSDLRRILGDDSRRLHSPTARTLSLDLSGAECDLIEFDEAIARADAASLERAVSLYSGPLLPGCLEEWAAPERTSREEAMLGALEKLSAYADERGDAAAVTTMLRRALEIDPLRESMVRTLMRAQAADGSLAAAVETYRIFRIRLRKEFNAEPDAQTVALFQDIRSEGRRATAAKIVKAKTGFPVEVSKGHLPTPLTPLIGRKQEIADIPASLEECRLLTLTGIGGIGKTRLALAVAHEIGTEFAGGAWFADLTPVADPDLITPTILSALSIPEQSARAPIDTLIDFLRPKRILLILDNCEHLAQACAHLAHALLTECPGLHILATSRETLRVTGEKAWRVPPLSLPSTGGGEASEAFQLFTDRAAQANAAFSLNANSRTEIAQICLRLDGIPLAIEMAAARMRAMSASQVAARLDDRFRLLTAPRGEQTARRQTLEATLDWSYNLLTKDEQTLLARLSVFAAGWALDAAEALSLARDQTLDLLADLVDKSLVVYEGDGGHGRYRLLETVRQYAQERLTESGTASAAGHAHRDYFLGYAEQAKSHMNGPRAAEWLIQLETEHENLCAALAWSLEHGPIPATLRLCCALQRFWQVRGHLTEGRAFLSAALLASPVEPQQDAWRQALRAEGHLAMCQGRLSEACEFFERGMTAARLAGDRWSEAAALGDLGMVQSSCGDHGAARNLLEQALSLNRVHGNRVEQAANLGGLGYLARESGDHAAAENYLTEAVALSREQGDAFSEGSNLGSLAYVLLERDDRAGARFLLDRTLELYRGLGNRLGEAWTLSSLSHVASQDGLTTEAIVLVQQALAINRDVGNRAGEAWSLNILGELQAREGEYHAAQETLRESLHIDRETGSRSSEARTLQKLGDVARKAGDMASARTFYDAALRLMRELNLHHGLESIMEAANDLNDDSADAGRPGSVYQNVERQ